MSIHESLPKSKNVVLSTGKTVEIPKLHTGDYYLVIMAFEALPTKIYEIIREDMDQISAETDSKSLMLRILPRLLAVAYDEILRIIATATKLESDFLANETHAEDLLALVDAFIEVNDVLGLVQRLKKMGTRLKEAGLISEKATIIPSKEH